jgi:hypothetical protein
MLLGCRGMTGAAARCGQVEASAGELQEKLEEAIFGQQVASIFVQRIFAHLCATHLCATHLCATRILVQRIFVQRISV